MAFGGIDLYNSRRGYNLFCKYWNRDNSKKIPANEYVRLEKPSGVFYAKETNSANIQKEEFATVFSFDSETIYIETQDQISNIEANALVEFDNSLWIAITIQRKRINKRSEYSTESSFKSYLQLKKNG